MLYNSKDYKTLLRMPAETRKQWRGKSTVYEARPERCERPSSRGPLTYAQLETLYAKSQERTGQFRARLGRLTHDEAVQQLSAAAIQVMLMRDEMEKARGCVGIPAQLKDLEASVEGAIKSLRALTRQLYPKSLEVFGFSATLQWLGADLRKRVGLEVRLEVEEVELAAQEGWLLFLIAEESLKNVEQHAKASTVRVVFKRELGRALLEVSDDGRGFQPGPPAPRFGLLGIIQNARSLAGRCEITSGPKGTQVMVRFPLGKSSSPPRKKAEAKR